MTVEELLGKIVHLKHHMRIWDHVADTLRSFLDQDIGETKVLEAEGCLVQHVPKAEIVLALDDVYDKLEEYKLQLRKLERFQVHDPELVAKPVAKPAAKPAVLKKKPGPKPPPKKVVAPEPAPERVPEPVPRKKPGPKPKNPAAAPTTKATSKEPHEPSAQSRSALRQATS